MGTKLKPGKFDCYANAAPDEPMFILLGRDKHAPQLMREWARLRRADLEDPAKVQEAFDCATAMEAWRREHRCPNTGSLPTGSVYGGRISRLRCTKRAGHEGAHFYDTHDPGDPPPARGDQGEGR